MSEAGDLDNGEQPIKIIRPPSQIPCFWSAISSGTSGSLIAGVVYYLGTSNVRKMHHIVMGSYVTFALGAWVYCRTQRKKAMEMIENKRELLQDIESNTS